MDFDSVITFLFIIAFFVLPSILKQVRAAKQKKAGTASPVPKKRTGLFGRLNEFVDRIAKEIEAQKQQQAGEKKEPSDIWQVLAEEEEWVPGQETIEPPPASKKRETARKKRHAIDQMMDPEMDPMMDRVIADRVQAAPERKKRSGIPPKPAFPRRSRRRRFSGNCRFRPNELQNAVVWSEILSKPVALRD